MDKIGFLFDLDGVIIDSESEYTRIWEEIEKKFPTGRENFALAIKGQTLTKILEDNFPVSIREEVKVMLHMLEEKMKYSYCRDAEEFIRELNSRGRRIAIVTSSDNMKMAHLFTDIPELRTNVYGIIDATKVSRSKPDPEGYLRGAEMLCREIGKCAVFEDSVQGVMAGRASGAYVIGIAGTKKREDLEPYCHIVVDRLREVDIEELENLLSDR